METKPSTLLLILGGSCMAQDEGTLHVNWSLRVNVALHLDMKKVPRQKKIFIILIDVSFIHGIS